jgi:hypothetical protein
MHTPFVLEPVNKVLTGKRATILVDTGQEVGEEGGGGDVATRFLGEGIDERDAEVHALRLQLLERGAASVAVDARRHCQHLRSAVRADAQVARYLQVRPRRHQDLALHIDKEVDIHNIVNVKINKCINMDMDMDMQRKRKRKRKRNMNTKRHI